MNRILRKRIPRQIRADFLRLGSLFLIIAMCMYIVISLVDAAEVVIRGTEKNQADSHLEDGQFTVFYPLPDDRIEEIKNKGVTIEPHFSFDVTLDDGSVLRIFRDRKLIDTVTLDIGTDAASENEIVLEKRYCEEHNIRVGDKISIDSEELTVTGIGSSVDYDAPLKKLSDTAVDSTIFGTGFMTPEGYEGLKMSDKGGTEDYTYAFLLNGNMSSDDLKQMIKDFDFDYKSVDDPFYVEMLDDTYGKKDEITDGINDLYDGAKELYDGAGELYDGAKELYDGTVELENGLDELKDGSKELDNGARKLVNSLAVIPGASDAAAPLVKGTSKLNDGMKDAYEGATELKEGAAELYDGTDELKDGAGELYDGVKELKDRSDEL